MPDSPRRPCNFPGCGELVRRGYCHQHAKMVARRYEQIRGTPEERGYDHRWRTYAHAYLRQHPLCAICMERGQIEQAECVDHKIPVTGPDDPLFWDQNNHQALSKRCHSSKTVVEDGGFGNQKKQKRPTLHLPAKKYGMA